MGRISVGGRSSMRKKCGSEKELKKTKKYLGIGRSQDVYRTLRVLLNEPNCS